MSGFNENFGLVLGFCGVVLFGGTLPATRLTVAAIDPLLLTAARASTAGLAGISVFVLRRRIAPLSRWGESFLASLCTIVGFPMFTALAMVSVPAAHGGVVLGIVPLAAAAALVAQERPSAGFWIVSLAGAAIVVAFVLSERDARTFALGDLYLLGTVLAGAIGYALSGRLSLRMPGWEVVSWQVAGFLRIFCALDLCALAARPFGGTAGRLGRPRLCGPGRPILRLFRFQRCDGHDGCRPHRAIDAVAAFRDRRACRTPVNGELIRLTTLAYAAAVVATVFVGQRMSVHRK